MTDAEAKETRERAAVTVYAFACGMLEGLEKHLETSGNPEPDEMWGHVRVCLEHVLRTDPDMVAEFCARGAAILRKAEGATDNEEPSQ